MDRTDRQCWYPGTGRIIEKQLFIYEVHETNLIQMNVNNVEIAGQIIKNEFKSNASKNDKLYNDFRAFYKCLNGLVVESKRT